MVTILLAAYNGERFLKEQLDSLLSQTVKEIQILYSDDGSTDHTLDILEEYEARFPDTIKRLSGKKTGSAWANFFRLLSEAEGDYFMLCDQDDVWLPQKVELTLKEMKAMEAKYGNKKPLLVHSDLSVTDKKGRVIHPSMVKYQKIAVKDNRFSHYLVENNITGNTVMINQALRHYLSFIPEECVMHDWWLGLLASCFGEIAYIGRPLLLYRQHEDNQVGSQGGLAQMMNRRRNHQAVRENYRKMFAQAEQFFNHYRNELSAGQQRTAEQFLALASMGRIKKIRTMIKYQFVKSTPFRTILQMFSI